jgi:acyl-CoA reductase-like NAD-dependent aldehyde dehydrogenase
VINPATEETIGHAPVAGRPEAEAAIASAREAFDHGPWGRMPARERATLLQSFHDALMRREQQIVELNIAEAGSSQLEARPMHFALGMKHLQYYIEASLRDPAVSLPVSVTPDPLGRKTLGAHMMIREPIGVVTGITAYNYPHLLNLAKVGPALAAGNTLVLKPSPYTPYEALILGEAADEAGLPKGVLNIVTGGKDVGELLTTDPRVDMISFTGSDPVGAAIMSQGAPTLKRIHLELGGKSALIVLEDADLQAAAMTGLWNFTTHCGQGCALMTRHLVHNSVRKRYVEILSDLTSKVKVGDPADSSVAMGPLIRAVQRDRVEQYVELGKTSGARLVSGGKRPVQLKRGFFYEPTIFDGVDNRARIAQEEIFGPVVCVIGFNTDEEAIALANDSRYGLSGGVFSSDAGRAYEVGLRLRTGGVLINGGGGTMSSHQPFGGYKRSGIGREYGIEGLNEFTQIKAMSFHSA